MRSVSAHGFRGMSGHHEGDGMPRAALSIVVGMRGGRSFILWLTKKQRKYQEPETDITFKSLLLGS